MTEFLMLFPDRDVAEQIADELLEEDAFTEVRVVREALAGDEGEGHEWGVHVRQATIDDPASAVAQALAERFEKLADDNDGRLDDNPAQQPTR